MKRAASLLALVLASPLARADVPVGAPSESASSGAAYAAGARTPFDGSTLPPWSDPDDLPIPSWARSVAPRKNDVPIFPEPGKIDARRGVVMPGARLPLFGAKRGASCAGRWLEVGPLAWICSDAAEMSPDERLTPTIARADDGLPFRYYFAGRDGANAFLNLEHALDEAPDYDLEPGFVTPVVEERMAHGERWAKTRRGRWIAVRELGLAHPSTFHGEELHGELDVAWVTTDRANVYAQAKMEKAVDTRVRLQVVHWFEEATTPAGAMLRISAEGEAPKWMRARDVARPTAAPPPEDIGGAGTQENWIDVELATQTLVAYEGTRPTFATLVSTGIGARGSETATPPGVHRIWVKLFTTNMDNLDRETTSSWSDSDEPKAPEVKHYSIEDVPWVMFFDKAVALHGAFWHRDFGHVKSHGCVNLTPLDARRIFDWTAPHLPAGWSAAFPSRLERGTTVRVR